AFPGPSVPVKPTRTSRPRSGVTALTRAGSTVRHPDTIARTATRRRGRPARARQTALAPTDRVDEPAHALGVDGLVDIALALHVRAHDQAIRDGEELGRALGRDA